MKRGYVCNRWPFLKIGSHIAFQDGFYETDDLSLQGLIESRDYFGVHVHHKEHYVTPTASETAAETTSVEPEKPKPKVTLGRRGSR